MIIKAEYLKKLIKCVKKDVPLSRSVTPDSPFCLRLMDVFGHASILMPNHKGYFDNLAYRYDRDYISGTDTLKTLDYALTLLSLQNEITEIKDRKLFADAEDKLRQAGIAFQNEDHDGVFNSLHTAVELALKDELDIPRTISKIKKNRVIEICIKEKIGPTEYFKEVKKHLFLNNKSKHVGFKPGKLESINAIAAVESLLKKIKKQQIKLTESAKEKIFRGI